jgi:predicted Fe-Mo cluster-binding NifX family protein
MKLAVTAEAANLEAPVDPRFGRCPFFLIVDPADMSFEAIPNPHADRQGGAGIQAAKLMADRGVEVVCTGNLGPNAVEALNASHIRTLTGCSGTVRQVVEQFKTTGSAGGPDVAPAPAPPTAAGVIPGSGFGRGGGRGMAFRRGGGRGWGGGRGRGGGQFGPGRGMGRRQRACWAWW